jgi:hypothetical protein
MINHQKPISAYPKFIIGWMYVYLFFCLLVLPMGIFDPNLFSAPTLADSIFFIASTLILIALSGCAIYLLHKRKKIASTLVVVTILLSYGFSSSPIGTYVEEENIVSAFVFWTLFIVIDTVAVLYVMLSKEMKEKFNKS